MARETALDTRLPTTGAAAIPYPELRELAGHYLANMAEMAVGTVTGTGALLTIEDLPFDPAVVILFNRTDPTLAVKTAGMAGDDCMKLTDAPALTYVTSGGITLGTKEFSLGTDADLNVAAEVIEWVALGAKTATGVTGAV